MSIEFNRLSKNEFNDKYGVEVVTSMGIDEFTSSIESDELNYFYCSYHEDDVAVAIEKEKEVAELLKLEFVYVDGFYVALYRR